MSLKWINIFFAVVISLAASCSGNEQTETAEKQIPVINYKTAKDSARQEQAPIINIVDTAAPEWNVIYMKDSAAGSNRIALKLASIYHQKLPDFAKKNKLNFTGPPMAWYTPAKKGSGFFFEAGMPVNKKPAKTTKKILFRSVGKLGDSALIAHFYGPYELTYYAYEALKERLADLGKKPKGRIFEVYVGDPMDEEGKPIDPYKVRTDIVALYE